MKQGPSHGARNGKTERQRIHHAAHSAARKARKEYKSMLDTFLNCPRCRKSQTSIGWNIELCASYDAIAAEDQS